MAYSVDNMASQRTLRPKREVRKLHVGDDNFLPRNPDLQEQHFQTRIEVERLISKTIVKNEVTLFSIV